MEAVLVRKLRQALASQEPLTEEHVVSLLVTIRKLLQHTGQQQSYFALNFHCSWAVHAVMDQGKGPARILHRLDGVYDVLKDTMLHDLERSLYNELHATTVWETFRTDLEAFLTAYSLPTTIVQGDWTQFLHRMQRGLSHAELAAHLALPTARRLEDIEAGRGVGALDLDVALALADFCGVTLGQMVGEGSGPGVA